MHDERDHELRAALFGIEAVAQCLATQPEQIPVDEQRQLTSALAAEARRLRAMLDPAAQETTAFELVDALRPVVTTARAAGLAVHESIPPGVAVHGRCDQAAQALLAVLDNARLHAAPSAVEIRVTTDGERTCLYVEDRGPGLPADDTERVFERGVSSPSTLGTGLGLFVARRLMESQGGSLSAAARPGGGTSFVLRFRTAATTPPEAVGAIAARQRDAR